MSEQIKFKRSLFGISKKPVMAYINSVSKSLEDKLFKKDTEITLEKGKSMEPFTQNKSAMKKITMKLMKLR